MKTAILRHSSRDAWFVALAALQAVLLLTVPSALLIALGLWWNANTVAHNFIHLPFFRARWANVAFSFLLTLLIGMPQTVWRDRHLAHHAGKPWRMRWNAQVVAELGLVAGLWIVLLSRGVGSFVGTWVLGWSAGLLLCQLQGHFEHVRGTVSHYGAWYNTLFFNDGYHVEHHARPGMHWSALAAQPAADNAPSRFPAVLRWLESPVLDTLERLVLPSRLLQRFMLDSHERAMRELLANEPAPHRIVIIGGGLFPRSAIILSRLAPRAEIVVVEQSSAHMERAREFLTSPVTEVLAAYRRQHAVGADLVVVPLAYVGDRETFYRDPPAPRVLVHEWMWTRRGATRLVSLLLLKRINLVTPSPVVEAAGA